MKQYLQATIESQTQIGPDAYSMLLKAPQIAKHAAPGQFAMIYLNKGELLLPRPISLCDVDKLNGTITLVYVAIGAGTKIMRNWQAGQTINIMGPIGNGFAKNLSAKPQESVAIVAGGMGVPPMLFLLKQLTQKGINVDVFLGFKQKYDLPNLFKPYAANLHVATDDGSMGQKVTVLDLLENNNNTYKYIFSCGPIPMLRALASYAKSRNIPCEVALEERMACGIGACKGCVVKTMVGYMLCCTYGPVFDSQEVNWDA